MRRELIVREDPKSPISEIFRTLRTNIQFMNNRNKLKTILITSTLPGEGKSWVSANLAVTFAQAGKKVIILDSDMRKGRQYNIFNVAPRPGLSNYLSGFSEDGKEVDLADYIQETEVENLFVIPAGNVPPNPSELLISENMINLIEELKEIFDIVIVDGPPTQLVTDSLILTRIVDTTVIVTASNQTKKDNLRRVVNNIEKVGGKIAGIIVNKVPVSAKKFEETYYYGSIPENKAKTKNKKRKPESKSAIAAREMRNRNTERARQLVQQNRKKEEIEVKEVKRVRKVKDSKTDTSKIEKKNVSEPTQQRRVKKEQSTVALEKSKLNIANKNKMNAEGLEKTNDILRQINEYIEEEKKKLQ